jgi:hypothetical protein
MQFAAFTRRTFLTVSFPGVLSLPMAAQTNRSTAAVPSLHTSEETAARTSEPLQLTDIGDRQMNHACLALPN